MNRWLAAWLAACLSWPFAASAQEVAWDPAWPRYSAGDAIATVVFAALAVGAEIAGGPAKPRWDREILLDLPVRRAVGARTGTGEARAATISDIMAVGLITAPAIDAALIGGVVHRDGTVATQLGLISLESMAFTFGVTNLTKVAVGRARPAIADCFARRSEDPRAACAPRPTVSFFSGHSASAFTGAGLVCAAGSAMPIHGSGLGGQVPCISGLAIAAATATLRLVANKHHLSDVIVGTGIGLLSGWAFPHLRYFAR